MWTDRGNVGYLEKVFSILRFRRRGVESFRRFIVLNVWSGQNANELRDAYPTTQAMRVRFR